MHGPESVLAATEGSFLPSADSDLLDQMETAGRRYPSLLDLPALRWVDLRNTWKSVRPPPDLQISRAAIHGMGFGPVPDPSKDGGRSEEHTSELQSLRHLV